MDLARFKGMKILVVDDHEPIRRLIRSVLKSVAVANVREVSDGREAIKLLRSFTPDMALVDIRMKPMGGIEFVQMLRNSSDEDGLPNDLPVVMVTGVEDENAIMEAVRSGADTVVTKPILPKALLERMSIGLDNAKQRIQPDE